MGTDARTLIGNLIAGSGWDDSESLGGIAGRVADEILSIHAHELAEKILTAPFQEHLLQRHQRAAAAKIIFTEVSKS